MAGKKTKDDKVIKDENKEGLLELRGQLARALADYDNLVKRVERERSDLAKIASLGIIIRLLPVLDNLESAERNLKDQGLAISIGEFKKVLNEEGLTEIKPEIGTKFDENIMEAIEVVSGTGNNNVAELVLPGWKFTDGTVVRPAKVKVTK